MTFESHGADPEALERAANQLEEIARGLLRVAQATQEYKGKIAPIARGIAQEVGGTSTANDRRIAALLEGVATSVTRSAAAGHQAANVAKRLAAEARAQAVEVRRQQEVERTRRRGTGRY